MFWNITSGKSQPITEAIAGPLAGDWLIDEILGTPNGGTLIRSVVRIDSRDGSHDCPRIELPSFAWLHSWGEAGFNKGETSVECATAWGTWDLNYGYEGHAFITVLLLSD